MQYIDEVIKIPILDKGLLYHYTSAEAFNGMINNNEMWATDSNFMNDKRELKYTYNLLNECLTDKMPHVKAKDMLIRELNKLVESSFDYDNKPWEWYIISFSLSEDNLTLWSEFSNPVGYSLGFDVSSLVDTFESSSALVLHGKVQYNRKKQIELLRYGIDEAMTFRDEYDIYKRIENFNDNTPIEIIKLLAQDLQIVGLTYSFFFKGSEFHNEKEYRFICNNIPSKMNKMNNTVYSRIRDGIFIPYITIPIDMSALLRSITVCPQNNSDILIDGVKALCQHRGIKVPITESSIKLRY